MVFVLFDGVKSFQLVWFFLFFFFNDTATTEIYTLSLHDALPISPGADDLLVLGIGDPAGLGQRRLARFDGGGGRIEALLPEQLLGEEVGIPAEQDVRPPPRHVGGDGNGALPPGLSHDLRLALV